MPQAEGSSTISLHTETPSREDAAGRGVFDDLAAHRDPSLTVPLEGEPGCGFISCFIGNLSCLLPLSSGIPATLLRPKGR